ncbi:MAG: ATP-dependent DNA ligase [Candidatus Hydrothermarchaeota archaeon]
MSHLKYSELVAVYEHIESTTKRLEMTDYLVDLFKKCDEDIVDKVAYLTQGKLYPDFVDLEMGIAEKLAIRAISGAFGVSTKEIEKDLKKRGDLGLTAEHLAKSKKQSTLFAKPLTVKEVYETFDKIARSTGPGSVDLKIRLLSGLLADATPKEAKYIIRAVLGKLRLGIADMTILDALSIAYTNDKANRELIERAYNLTSDLGDVAKTLAREGLEGMRNYHVKVGRPIRMMMAQRLVTPEEVLEKLGGKAACEWKYDGERIQIHKNKDNIALFSRRLENITNQYPDVSELIKKNITARDAIIEGECVAVDPDTEDLLPFQQLMHRRRKHGIEEAKEKFPISLYLFDLLYIDGEDLTQKSYMDRRNRLKSIVKENTRIRCAKSLITDDPKEIENFFELAVASGCEGLILKSLDGVYQAGARGWLWIKLKRSYQSMMIEPIDVVVVGAFVGRGKRSGTYGALLTGVIDREEQKFYTVCKVGSGFTDDDLEKIPEMLLPYKIDEKHPSVESELEADVWFEPNLVMEIIGDELTLSPVHTCAFGRIREDSGIAVRFPRFTGRWRIDKGPNEATSVEEIVEMYRAQLKRVEEVRKEEA